MYNETLEKEVFSSQNLTTGDVGTFTPTVPVEIVEFGVVVTTAFAASDNFILAADRRITAGSDTGRGDGDAGTLTIAAASTAAVVAGDVVISRPATKLLVYPGQQVVLEVTNGNASGVGLPFINYRYVATADRASTILNAVAS